MTRKRTRGMLLAAVLLAGTTGSAAVSAAAAATADAPRLTGNGLPMLDPAFGNDAHFMKALALALYKESPVTAYLPTRLPDSGWRYYGMRSQLTEDGYKLTAYRSAKAVPAETMLLGAEAAAVPAASDVLYRLAAGHAAEAGLAVPASAKLVQGDGTVGWKFWSSGADAESEEQLSRKFAALVKTGAPVSGATGTVLVTRADDGKLTYSASWTNDGRTHYSFVGYGSLDDFVSMLTSFRPVINLFDAADIVLLPDDMQLNLQPGRGSMFVPYENRFVSLAKAPLVKNGTAFLPLRDIARIIGGEIQYVAEGSGNAVYVSRNGWQNELKLRLSTGDVFRKGEKLATVPLVVQEGTTLVPLRFMSDLYGLPVTYDAASQAITVHRANWFTNHAVPSVGSGADYKTSVLSVGGPPFTYSNGRLGQGPVWGYEQRKPPLGYNSLKYQVYHVGVPLLPGDNSFVLRDMQTKRVIDSIPLRTTMTAADVPFRTDGAMLADGLKPDLRLTGSNGKSWPGGYAEISDGAAVDLAGKGWSYDYVQLSYRFGELESKRVQIPVKDGTLAYRLIPNKGPGTYEVTLYTPPGIMPGMGEKAAAPLVRFVVVIL